MLTWTEATRALRRGLEHRRSERRLLGDLATCSLADAESGQPLPAGVLDLSRHGVRLLLCQPLPPGTILGLTLAGDRGPGLGPVPARVVHCTEQADGTFILGGEFLTPLTDDEFTASLPPEA